MYASGLSDALVTTFQYNTCFGSTILNVTRPTLNKISIQHLFRFDSVELSTITTATFISIQHLFRFDKTSVKRIEATTLFQYNTCFGSTNYLTAINRSFLKFQYNTCFGSTNSSRIFYNKFTFISIQHLFRFDDVSAGTPQETSSFQYNTCFGST